MLDNQFARAADIAIDLLALLDPPPRFSLSEYAIRHRKLANHGGGLVGDYSHAAAPYLVEPMDCLTSLDYLNVAIVGPGQCAKTTAAENWLQYSVEADPAKLLWYMQSEPAAQAYVKDRINPMIELHSKMQERRGKRPEDNSLHFKKFLGMNVEFLSANDKTVVNKSAPRIVADEIDAYPDSLGDVIALLDVRRQSFGRQSKILAISHPDKARGPDPDNDWTAGIMALYGDSDRRVWYWPCPHCSGWSSPVPIAKRYMALDYPEDASLDVIEEKTHLICPINGCVIADSHRVTMNAQGRWIGKGQNISESGAVTGERIKTTTAGFWIVGAMSQFIIGGIGGLARARVKAERELEISGDDKSLRQVMVKKWGIPYAPRRAVGMVDVNALTERVEPSLQLGTVPEGVRFLTAAADVQVGYFEYLVRGWGAEGESWIIDRGKILADPATVPEDWDKLLHEVFLRDYPLADDTARTMRIRGSGYDSAGQSGVTQQAYAAWNRWRRQRDIRLYGNIDGREVWSVMPLKGASKIGAPLLQVVRPETDRKANKVSAQGTVPVAVFNPNRFKDDLAGQLQRAMPGPLYVHFPAALLSREKPHVFFTQLVSEEPKKNGRWEKITPSMRNEQLDLMVMTHTLARLHGLSLINWGRPPIWAAEWDKNPLVSPAAASEDMPKAPILSPGAQLARTFNQRGV
jgi:phage terminase large subunit GpA-like protein